MKWESESSSVKITSSDDQHHHSELGKLSRSMLSDASTLSSIDDYGEDRLKHATSRGYGDKDVEVAKIKLVRVGSLRDSRCMVMMLNEAGEEIAKIPVGMLDGRIRLRYLVKNIRRILRSGEIIVDGEYVYRAFHIHGIVGIIVTCLSVGVSSLEVFKYRLSRGEVELARALKKEGLSFKQKVRIGHYVADFKISGVRELFIDVVKEGDGDSKRTMELQDKMEKILKRDHLYYWILEEEVLSNIHEIVKLLVGVSSGSKVYPAGILTAKRLRVDGNSINTTIELRLRKEILPDEKRRVVDVYEVSRYMIKSVGSIRLPQGANKYARFSQDLCNLFGDSYFYSFDTAWYKRIYSRLVRFGKARIVVKKLTPDSSRMLEEDGGQK
jgi:very-short-patch-repair endonuclease